MTKRLLSIFLTCLILLISGNFAFAQSKSDWTAVESLVNQEVAIKTNGGKTVYGIIKSVDPNSLVLQTAGNKNLTQTEKTINRSEIKKIWRSLLFVNDRNIGKGVLIGTGVGLGLGLITFSAGEKGAQSGAIVPLLTLAGTAVGGVGGFFTKKKHKKRDLIYQN